MILSLLFTVHFIADFVLQSRKVGENKSSDWKYLAEHMVIQYLCFFAAVFVFTDLNWKMATIFAGLNTVVHGVVDKFIWVGYSFIVKRRITKQVEAAKVPDRNYSRDYTARMVEKYARQFKIDKAYVKDYWFWNFVGFDQILHIQTILFLYYMFKESM